MATIRKTIIALKDILATLEADLDWLTPAGRDEFLQRMRRERDETTVILLNEPPTTCSTEDAAILRRVAASLRADGDPARAALADRLDAWTAGG
ncbi:hypothetical protein [Salinarimonas sp.]|uniref:hypothetical protein n=1 Tax=Salinarimonas sp. TaxID=2766526 RepID=UPI00391D24D3